MLSSDQWLLSLSSTCLSFSTGNNAYISWKEKKEKETMLIVGCTNCADWEDVGLQTSTSPIKGAVSLSFQSKFLLFDSVRRNILCKFSMPPNDWWYLYKVLLLHS
jgi:hypothetical protein